MGRINDIDLKNWKESDVWTDSLWIINDRDNTGKHDGFYHGNFIPQVPRQLIKKFSRRGGVVIDLFLGSGTSAYEAELLGRNFIGVDIVPEMVSYVSSKLERKGQYFFETLVGDSASASTECKIKNILKHHKKTFSDLVILHPPYADVIKFSNQENDLSNAKNLKEFLEMFSNVLKVANNLLKQGGYLSMVVGDVYKQGEWVPLGFYCMREAQNMGFKLKSIVIKNMSGNRGKRNNEAIWRYRSLASDYYIFKHEYIFILKKK